MTLFWVTGAAGFIGRHLIRHLTGRGAVVAGLDAAGMAPAGLAGWRQAAISPAALSALAGDTGLPDTIYHLAGGSSVGASIADPKGDFLATVGGTCMLLEWLRIHSPQTRLVIASSAAVYGNLHFGPITDKAATSPYSPYGVHKFAMEVVCRGWADNYGLQVLAARLFSVYGPGLRKQLLWDLSRKLCSTATVVELGGTGKELRDWTHVEDVVRALDVLAPFASPEMPVVNVGTGVAASVRTIAESLALAHDRDPECLLFSGQVRAGDPLSLVAAPGLLHELGFNWQKEIDDGIAQYAAWYKSDGQE